MKAAIRERALTLGFDDCGFTTAEPPDSSERFKRWLGEGQQGEMAYLARNAHKRVDPQKVLPGAKTIIVVGVSYEVQSPKSKVQSPEVSPRSTVHSPQSTVHSPQSTVHSPEASPQSGVCGPQSTVRGIIARYAQYCNYHKIIGARLKTLTAFVNQLGGPGTRSLWYVDTGPLLERDLAQRAGLGFIGKHTNLISRKLGNWIFLAEILTTLDIEPDGPEPNRCGSCARCIAACPTRAIKGPFQLDARLCISYLTIELKGAIPTHFRGLIGNRIYGCDDCLAVCPWNRFAREGTLMKTHARQDLGTLDLLKLLALDQAGFHELFAGTPIMRAKRAGLLRNVCVALGNTADETALPALQRAADEDEPLIAEHARWAIEQIRGQKKAAPP